MGNSFWCPVPNSIANTKVPYKNVPTDEPANSKIVSASELSKAKHFFRNVQGKDTYWIEGFVTAMKDWNEQTGEKIYTVKTPASSDSQTFRLLGNNPYYSTIHKNIKVNNLCKLLYYENFEIIDVQGIKIYTNKIKIMDCIASDIKKSVSNESMSQLLIKDPIKLYDKNIVLLIETNKVAALELNTEYDIKFQWWGYSYLVIDISVEKKSEQAK